MTSELLHHSISIVLEQYKLSPDGIHGIAHWARVLENGRRLVPLTGARLDVVEYFAIFHDSFRWDDGLDFDHGRRAAQYLAENARSLLPDLDGEGRRLLCQACAGHVDGLRKGDISVLTCWDADRLDLSRAGITPDPNRLCTSASREPELLAWAKERSYQHTIPDLVLQEWGLTMDFREVPHIHN